MKPVVKTALLLLAVGLTAPWWILVKLLSLAGRDEQWFVGSAQLFSLVPGLSGVFLRRGFYRMTLESFDQSCFVGFGTWFSHREVHIGANVYIGSHCVVGMCHIDDNVLIGSNVDILSGKNQHQFSDPDTPINRQGGRFEKVNIGEDCWIGNSAVVVANIEARCVIGAGSVVVSDIPKWSIAAGNPARVIKTRCCPSGTA